MLMVIILVKTAIGGFHDVWQQLNANWEQLRKIETHTNFLADISRQLDNIEGNAIDEMEDFVRDTEGILNDLAVNVKGNYNTLEQQQEDIGYIKMRINHILGLMHPAHEVVKQQPCYAPNGICTNPQMDCINCPKRGTGGTWSTNTSIKAEDAPLQEFFNDNKEK